ncbi:MAG: hypothetical protein LBT66_08160 [Methanobrevibacter sp.]|jgi:hypothetical protein|nr:hypothetical protein [Candidatus Methanovirga meridionalis]
MSQKLREVLYLNYLKEILKRNNYIWWNNNPSIIQDIDEGLSNGNVYVFDLNSSIEYPTMNDFNKTIIENGFSLTKIKDISKFEEYPTHVYMINQ